MQPQRTPDYSAANIAKAGPTLAGLVDYGFADVEPKIGKSIGASIAPTGATIPVHWRQPVSPPFSGASDERGSMSMANEKTSSALPGKPAPDGVRIRTPVRGTGLPLLLLTGIGASLDLSAPLERALNSHGVQTLALDAPGTGESSRYRRPRRMPGLARTAEQTLDALGYDRVDVLGVSFGGILAQQLAHQAPQRVRRLVLAATAAGVPGLGGLPGSPRALLALATPAATGRPTTTAASPGRCTAGRPDATPTRCCTARSRGSPKARPCAATSLSYTRSASGPACLGCDGSGNPPWYSLATTTPSFQ